MTTELIKALTEARQPDWAVKVGEWRPDGVDGSYYRMVDGPIQASFGGHEVLPQIHQNTKSGEHAGLDLSWRDDDGKLEALIDDMSAKEARHLAASLIRGAEMLEQWAGVTS